MKKKMLLLLKKMCWIFQRGEKMTTEEVNAIFSMADINKDGKLDYAEVSLNYNVDYNAVTTAV